MGVDKHYIAIPCLAFSEQKNESREKLSFKVSRVASTHIQTEWVRHLHPRRAP
jgi:hypothetical protein